MANKPNLILLHGALGCKDQYNALIPLLEDKFNTYSLNFYGHGGKVCLESFSVDLFVEDVFQFMEVKGIDKTNFFGFSLGGYVALKFARRYPQKVNMIMTLGTKFEWNPKSAAREILYLDPDTIMSKVPAYAEQLEERHAPVNWKEVVRKTAQMIERLGNGEAMKASDLDNIHPTLISRGSLDNMVAYNESVKAASSLPNGAYFEFPDMKHPIEKVNKDLLVDKMEQFFL